ncbi:hypothetical protein N0V93_008653 [Gnomoniopsis smithogilvyi]|uniref:Uncharacterized protein n=1 Tax=Gnomoniopsis smithogilvyi TaxID=1191159 RepID=A0A9W8YNE6_9PEZI|nr:hypothetical protein N0V93_008653 [Gnomoniopsis smithogilvyi]
MQFSQIFAVVAIVGSAVAVPNHNVELAKRACWELSGEALTICQDACKAVCAAASLGLATVACSEACDLSNLKRDEPLQIEARANTAVAQITNIDAVDLNVDASVGRDACVVACEVTCNSTILALVQTECLEKCKGLCPSS